MAKPRIPLPKQVEKVHQDKTKYNRKRTKQEEYGHEWNVDCPICGKFIAIQKGEPTICPKCHEPDIDTIQRE